jgi:hypothetical protein
MSIYEDSSSVRPSQPRIAFVGRGLLKPPLPTRPNLDDGLKRLILPHIRLRLPQLTTLIVYHIVVLIITYIKCIVYHCHVFNVHIVIVMCLICTL